MKLKDIVSTQDITYVAPHAGAWIEIYIGTHLTIPIKSHPMRVRGLKYGALAKAYIRHNVAPHAGAWIEIAAFGDIMQVKMQSHPMRVRGLK